MHDRFERNSLRLPFTRTTTLGIMDAETPTRLRGTALVVGPVPPPIMGPSLYTALLCEALDAAGATILRVNTQDRRSVFNVGLLDIRNVYLALAHGAQLARHAALKPVRATYIPISQNRWGYARDALLIALSHLFRRPVVVHLHGARFQPFYDESTKLERWLIRLTLGWAARALVLTPNLVSVFHGLVERERVRVLENGIPDPWPDTSSAMLEARRRRQPIRLLFVANDFAVKGAETLVRVVARPEFADLTLRMIGKPPSNVAAATARLASELGAGDRISLTGELTDEAKFAEYEQADLFLYPSYNDGQPLVVLEAMAAGLPIVASTVGGIPDTLSETGLLVPPHNEDALASALGELVRDAELRSRLGRAARRRFESRYTLSTFRARCTEVFAELMPDR
jgi:glycosyltransferase involved in cell wall biosynthesis